MLIFAGYAGIGWDLYSIANPLKMPEKKISQTNYVTVDVSDDENIADLRKHKTGHEGIGF